MNSSIATVTSYFPQNASPLNAFNSAFEKLIEHEGGYANHPDDKGGETKYGISKRSYPNMDIEKLTLEDAKLIYFRNYWVQNLCSQFSPTVGEKLFDLSVNLGNKTAAVLLQRALRACNQKVIEDGIIGPKTIDASFRVSDDKISTALKSEAAGYYRLIAAQDTTQKVFLDGWLNRAYA